MGGLCFHSGRWPDALWQRHSDHSMSAHKALEHGKAKQGEAFSGFAQDVHSRLYLHHAPPTRETAPEWATTLHKTMGETPEYRTLKSRCGNNGFLAGIATETMLSSLLESGQIPQGKPQEQDKATKSPGMPQGHSSPTGQTPDTGAGQDAAQDAQSDENRRAVRRAMREATEAANEAEEAVEGFLDLMQLPGSSLGEHETLESMDQVMQLYQAIRSMPRLKEIAELAGRLQRIARTQKRVKVSPAVGAVKGVTLGSDLARLLPSEIVGLRSPNRYQRLQALAKIQAGRALQYQMEGEQPQGRGPIILCCDQSGSMRLGSDGTVNGEREMWAKAIALALLATAAEQKRAFHYIGFDYAVRDEYSVPAGKATLEQILPILTTMASGGTDFDAPLIRALDVLKNESTMHKADIVFLTDGLADVSPWVVADYAKVKAQSGLSVYAIGVGSDAWLDSLTTIPTARYTLSQFSQREAEALAPALQAV